MIRNVFIVVVAGFLATSCTLLGEKPEVGNDAVAKPEKELTAVWISETVCSYKVGEWELQVEYLEKGSRSEGQNGKLLKAGKSVDPQKIGNALETPLGKLKHYGIERKVKWDITGWNFADRRKVKSSSRVVTGKDKK